MYDKEEHGTWFHTKTCSDEKHIKQLGKKTFYFNLEHRQEKITQVYGVSMEFMFFSY